MLSAAPSAPPVSVQTRASSRSNRLRRSGDDPRCALDWVSYAGGSLPDAIPQCDARVAPSERTRTGMLPSLLASDPAADALVAWMSRTGAPAKKQFEDRLRGGARLKDDAPEALLRFFERADLIPDWVDFDEIAMGARAYQRFGLMGMIVLSAWSLINGYHSSAAVKPLAFTGQLKHNAQRRLAETARFVSEASQVGYGLRRGRPGWEISLRVRLIHAHVRQACLESAGWRTAIGAFQSTRPTCLERFSSSLC